MSRLGSPLQGELSLAGVCEGRRAPVSTEARQEVPLWSWDNAYGENWSFYTWDFTAVFSSKHHFILFWKVHFVSESDFVAIVEELKYFLWVVSIHRTVLKATALRKLVLKQFVTFGLKIEQFRVVRRPQQRQEAPKRVKMGC